MSSRLARGKGAFEVDERGRRPNIWRVPEILSVQGRVRGRRAGARTKHLASRQRKLWREPVKLTSGKGAFEVGDRRRRLKDWRARLIAIAGKGALQMSRREPQGEWIQLAPTSS